MSSPRRLLLLFGGNIGSQVLYGAVLAGCLHAYGADGELLLLGFVAHPAASLLGGLCPVPGVVGLWEGTAVAVLTAGGVDSTTATVAVLTHRSVTVASVRFERWWVRPWHWSVRSRRPS